MRKLSIKQLIEFSGKSDKSKKTFALNLQIDKQKQDSDGGGDYWVSCLSAISNSFKYNDNSIILDKIHQLEEKFEETDYKRTKDMYERNISILYKFEDIDFRKWMPAEGFDIIKKHKSDFLLDISGLQVQALPHHVFTFKNDDEEIGAIWFIAKLEGYNKYELAMFTDILYRYMNQTYSKNYKINSDFCIAVDVVNVINLSYTQIMEEKIPLRLDLTIDEIKKLM
ncbi:hypothetical protein E9993_17405 [Labilibacter sediminis]|nr:hypothetical protein E9993_17405 [Labilibacter sediminis]